MTLVGQGAADYAKKANLTLVNNKKLVSKKARSRYRKNLGYLRGFQGGGDSKRDNDTFGAKVIIKSDGGVDCVVSVDKERSDLNTKENDVMKECLDRYVLFIILVWFYTFCFPKEL